VGSVLGILVVLAIIVFVLGGLLSMLGSGGVYDQIGQGGLSAEPRKPSPPAPELSGGDPGDEEIRQMLTARSERLVRQGSAPLDIDTEIARLAGDGSASGGGGHDPGLVAETRQLVAARSERRVRAGLAALDVEAEIARVLAELGAGNPGDI
jgi:hypothetical protein